MNSVHDGHEDDNEDNECNQDHCDCGNDIPIGAVCPGNIVHRRIGEVLAQDNG